MVPRRDGQEQDDVGGLGQIHVPLSNVRKLPIKSTTSEYGSTRSNIRYSQIADKLFASQDHSEMLSKLGRHHGIAVRMLFTRRYSSSCASMSFCLYGLRPVYDGFVGILTFPEWRRSPSKGIIEIRLYIPGFRSEVL